MRSAEGQGGSMTITLNGRRTDNLRALPTIWEEMGSGRA